jgi:ceroid-lipofuscinosis MFS transporter 7
MTHISLLSLFQTLGFVLGPGMQAALSPIGEKSEIPDESTFHVDMYAACG